MNKQTNIRIKAAQRLSSTKTRIKTIHILRQNWISILRDYLPLKQGLRQLLSTITGNFMITQRLSSTKTRIKTFPMPLLVNPRTSSETIFH